MVQQQRSSEALWPSTAWSSLEDEMRDELVDALEKGKERG